MFNHQLKALTLLEKDDERLTFVICDEHISYGFSSENRDIIDYFYYPEEELTAIEAAILDENDILLVYGTDEGKVMFRENWTLAGKEFTLDSEIRMMKFSYNLDFLIALTANGSIFQITQTNGVYDNLSRSFGLDNEIPISINFNEELTDLIVTTLTNKVFRVSAKNFKVQDELEDSDYINLRRGEFRFAFSDESRDKSNEVYSNGSDYTEDCLILGNDLDYSICSDNYGNLVIYKNQISLQNNCGVYSLGHISKIQDMKLSVLKTHLVTIGLEDRICIE